MKYTFLLLAFTLLLGSCKVYKANYMFQTEHEYVVDSLRKLNENSDQNYRLQANDYIQIKVYTNQGERLVDPDFELSTLRTNTTLVRDEPHYLIRQDGKVNLPMVGQILISGKTLRECDSILSVEYTKYYFGVYVLTKVLNKRAIVFGPKAAKVIPLENDNVSVIELIALYGGMPEDGKAKNIKLIRGDYKNPDVQIIDLSTIEGMQKASLNVEPNDVVYIEPAKRMLPQTLQDIYPLFSLILSLLSILILVASVNRN